MPVSVTFPNTLPNPSGDDYSFDEAPRVKTAKFGDGYEQRAPDGLNTMPRTFSVMWPALTTADKDTLRDFLKARGGSEGFFWTPPKESDPIKVKATKWSVKTASGPYWNVTATFEEVFDA